MRYVSYGSALLLTLLLTVVPALLSGSYVQRWGPTPELAQSARRLPEFPRTFGVWQCVSDDEPCSAGVCQELGLEANFRRTYQNTENGRRVQLLLMVGQPGRLVRHPPDICLAARDVRFLEEQSVDLAVDGQQHRFGLILYERTLSLSNERVAAAYGHCDDVAWDLPAAPRVRYGAASQLFKVLATTAISPQDDNWRANVVEPFLVDFVRAFREHRQRE